MAHAVASTFSARFVQRVVLDHAGIQINGPNPWDPQVKNKRVFPEVLAKGSLGLGESYMRGDWECADLTGFFVRVMRLNRSALLQVPETVTQWLRMQLNLQTKARARQVIDVHYDAGNEMYASFLCPRMIYTCAYWKDVHTLEQAQVNKLNLICRKADIQEGHNVLDIGGGFGSFARYAAKQYGANVVVTSLSEQQTRYALEHNGDLPIEMRLEDYRDTVGPVQTDPTSRYDRIVSIGMFEAVGKRNFDTYFNKARSLVSDDGIFVLHTIISNTGYGQSNPWLDKYIFPGGYLAPEHEVLRAARKYFKIIDVHTFGQDYARTLRVWRENFVGNYPALVAKHPQFGKDFYRKHVYYLAKVEATFITKRTELAQFVLLPYENTRTYPKVR